MGYIDIDGNEISIGGSADARTLVTSTDFKTYFPMYYANYASKLGREQTFGKSVCIFGDSLHAYAGGDGISSSGFITEYNKYLGITHISNSAVAGKTWSGASNTGCAVQRVDALTTTYDVVIFAFGTNADSGGNGTADESASQTATTLAGAMKYCIETMRTKFPKTVIGVILPPPSTNRGVDTMSEVADLMQTICVSYNVPFVDMRQFVSTSDLSDGTHLAASGAMKYGAGEAELIKRICPYTDTIYATA